MKIHGHCNGNCCVVFTAPLSILTGAEVHCFLRCITAGGMQLRIFIQNPDVRVLFWSLVMCSTLV